MKCKETLQTFCKPFAKHHFAPNKEAASKKEEEKITMIMVIAHVAIFQVQIAQFFLSPPSLVLSEEKKEEEKRMRIMQLP